MTGWQVAPESESARMKLQKAREQDFRRLQLMANPELAVSMASISDYAPTLTPEVTLGAALSGQNDPAVLDQLVQADSQDGFFGFVANAFDEAIWDPVKGSVRWIGMLGEGLWDEVISRPQRMGALYDQQGEGAWQGYNPFNLLTQRGRDIYGETGDAPFGEFGTMVGQTASAFGRGDWQEAIGLQGNATNQGEGIFAESELAEEVELALARTQELGARIGTPDVDQQLVNWGMRAVGPGWTTMRPDQQRMIYLAKEREHIISRADGAKGGIYTNDQGVAQNLGRAQEMSGYGAPTTQRWRTQAEATFMPIRGSGNQTQQFTQVSPGRLVASAITQPGSTEYHLASGTMDFAAQLFVDPFDKLGLAVRGARRAGKSLGLGEEAVTAMRQAQDNRAAAKLVRKEIDEIEASGDLDKLSGYAESTQMRARQYGTTTEDVVGVRKAELQRLERRRQRHVEAQKQLAQLDRESNLASVMKSQAGLVDGRTRVDVDPADMNNWITGRTATPFVENFTRATTMDEVNQLLSHVKVPVSRQLRAALKEAKTNSEVVALLLPEVGGAITESGLKLVGRGGAGLITPMVKGIGHQTARMLGNRYTSRLVDNANSLRKWSKRQFGLTAPGMIDMDDLDRGYEKMELLAQNLNLNRADEALDGIFEDFARIEDGDFAEGYNVTKKFMTHAWNELTEAGLDERVATEVTRFTHQFRDAAIDSVTDATRKDAEWFVNRVGDVVREPNRTTKVLVGDMDVSNPGPQLITELFNGQIALADSDLIRKAVADTNRLGKFTNALATKGADKFFEQRVGLRWANAVMSQFWKPLVLLRVAWPFRVIGEEQTRMAASGLGSMFTYAPGSGHSPLSYLAMALGRKGGEDILGGDIAHAEEFMQAMARRANFDGEMGARGSRYWTTVRKGDDEYVDALTSELNMLWSDPIVQELFREGFEELDDVARIDDVADWLASGNGQQYLRQLTLNAPAETKKLMATPDGIRAYLEGVYARAHLKAGGRYKYIRADGSWVDDAGQTGRLSASEKKAWGDRQGYQIIEPGEDRILNAYTTGDLDGLNVRNKFTRDRNMLSTKGYTDYNSVRNKVGSIQESSRQVFPEALKGSKYTDDATEGLKAGYDRAVERAFDIFMTRPTNRLSRSPVFKETYWQRMAEMKPMMDQKTWDQVMAQADKVGMRKIMEGRKGSARATKLASSDKGQKAMLAAGDVGDMTLREADTLAKAFALETTKDLLYDLSRRHNVTEGMKLIFPFAEAFGEVASRWATIMNTEMLRPGRRFQQAVTSARESNPFDKESGYTNDGFFYDNERGDEVFAAGWPMPFSSVGKFEFEPGRLNFINGVIPGFGPTIQFASNLFLPDDPGWDPIREAISPYGGEGNLVAELMPSYLKRALAATDAGQAIIGDSNTEQAFNSAVVDVMRAKAQKDPEGYQYALENPEANEKWLKDAQSEARWLWFFRAGATYMLPTSPGFTPTIEDKNGQVLAVSVFTEAMYDLIDEMDGDTMAANQVFIDRYGVNPAPLLAGKSKQTVKRSNTEIGYAFQRANPELFAQYSTVAFYFGPTLAEEFSEFDYAAYANGLAEGTTKPLTPKEHQYMVNDMLARVELDKRIKDVEAKWGTKMDAPVDQWPGGSESKNDAQREIRAFRDTLISRYEGYDPYSAGPVVGTPSRAGVGQQIGELERMVRAKPESLSDDPTLAATEHYLHYREAAMAAARSAGADFGSFKDAGDGDPTHPMWKIRAWLRTRGEELIRAYPTFGPLYDEVFSREMASDRLNEEELIAEMAGGY